MSENRKANVLVQGIKAGMLSETEEGYEFVYSPEYINEKLPAVSLTLPLSKEKYVSRTLFPFFDGLISEGWLLDIAIKNWKLSADDRFGLLLSVCRDCIGDVSVVTEETDAL